MSWEGSRENIHPEIDRMVIEPGTLKTFCRHLTLVAQSLMPADKNNDCYKETVKCIRCPLSDQLLFFSQHLKCKYHHNNYSKQTAIMHHLFQRFQRYTPPLSAVIFFSCFYFCFYHCTYNALCTHRTESWLHAPCIIYRTLFVEVFFCCSLLALVNFATFDDHVISQHHQHHHHRHHSAQAPWLL